MPGRSGEGTLLGPALPAEMFLTELGVFIKRIILFNSLLVNRNPVSGVCFHTNQSLGLGLSCFLCSTSASSTCAFPGNQENKDLFPCSS